MKISDLIGSIMCFEKGSIDKKDIDKINTLCIEYSVEIERIQSITSLYCDLYDPNRVFEYCDERIVFRKDSFITSDRLKELYFNRLTSDEKKQIYCIVNRM